MRYIATLATCAALGAHATSSTTDFSDLWFNSNEEGWGMNIIQQRDIQFITLFVYGANGQPTWFVAPDTRYRGPNENGTLAFSGPLYATTGPYFGAGSFNEADVNNRLVGSIAFASGEVSGGAVSYTVDGVPVTKSIRRQTWRAESINGIYIGASLGTYAGCGAAQNGYLEAPITLTVTHDSASASSVTMREQGSNYFCNYAGTYSQEGRMGRIVGSGTCSDGTNQAFEANEVQVTLSALAMRFSSSFTGNCRFDGRLGGIRRGS